ncbi:MAG: hypothetical protein NWE80_04465 [Candidatus Bathyarchaeota archaeon]|nr:hypothetical protein [Candidatus Bathyarchaeota archaeon]
MSAQKKKEKTVTRTFRIKTKWDDVLRREAEEQGISANHLLNSILEKYTCFDSLARNMLLLLPLSSWDELV